MAIDLQSLLERGDSMPVKSVIIEFQDASEMWKQIAIVDGSDLVVKMQLDSYHASMKARVRARDRQTGGFDMRWQSVVKNSRTENTKSM